MKSIGATFRTKTIGVLLMWLLFAITTGAQNLLVSEGFEGTFPGSRWTIGDTNPLGLERFWGRVDSAYGSVAARSGDYKVYCAAAGTNATNFSAVYPVNISAFMTRSVNLSNYTYANLRFYYYTPSLGTGDLLRVQFNGSTVATRSTTNAGWTQVALSLNTLVGTEPDITFQFFSDATSTAEGVYIDDMEITAGTNILGEILVANSLTNYTGYVIDADAFTNNPAFNRESLLISTRFTVDNYNSIASTNVGYIFTYRLRDTNGALFPICDVGGNTNASWTYAITNTANIPTRNELNITNLASLRPAARLSPFTEYEVELSITRTNGTLVRNFTNSPRHFYHFTNLVSGDNAFNVLAELTDSGWERQWLINTAPGSNTFVLTNAVSIRRYDNFAGANSTDNIPIRLNVELRRAADNALIPLAYASSNYMASVLDYTSGTSNPPEPRERTNSFEFAVQPAGQLDSVNATYIAIVRLSYTNQPGQTSIAVNSMTNPSTRLLHFNGALNFNDIETTFTRVLNSPVASSVVAGSHINTSLYVADGAGSIDGNTNYTYGTGFARNVDLLPDGTAIYDGGQLAVNIDGPADNSDANFNFSLSGLAMGTNGARASTLTFTLPAGFGYTTNIAAVLLTRTYESSLAFLNVGLNDQMAPKSNLVFAPGGTIYCAEETKPLIFYASALTWSPSLRRLTMTASGTEVIHSRLFEYAALDVYAPDLYRTSMATKRSNDRFYFYADTVTGNPYISAGADGAARLTATVNFQTNGEFRAHFPRDSLIRWTNGGTMTIASDLVTVGPASRLAGVGAVAAIYRGDCEGCDGINTTNAIGARAPQTFLNFTRDGGLITATSSVPLILNFGSPQYTAVATNKLAWGYVPAAQEFAHSVSVPTNVTFHMPGTFLRGSDNTSTTEDGPGVLLLTGVQHDNLGVLERPKTAGYQAGLADYAGVNVRVLGDGWRNGRDTLCGQAFNFALRGNSKYYARPSGVSGIHSAVTTLSPTPQLWGYNLTFSNYSLAFLDSENVDSQTDGLLTLPPPAGFNLAFQDMLFSCPGGLLSAELPGTTGRKYLNYWNADFEPLALNFAPGDNGECDPGEGFLTLGVRAYATHVPEPLHGTLGFFPNGRIIARADGVEGVDSRLQMSANARLAGPNGSEYIINPVSDAYFNKYDPARAPVGFINFAGKINVPFFEDMKVHVHTQARAPENSSPNAPIALMGGWPRANSGNANHGWEISSKNYFNQSFFDTANLGFPSGLASLLNYQNSANEEYRPRAQKLWLGVVDMDYVLQWNSLLRSFSALQASEADLLVLRVSHQCSYLDPKSAVLDFGIQYDGLPKISVANMFVNALDESTGMLTAIQSAIGAGPTDTIQTGLRSFRTLLADQSSDLVEELFDQPAMNTIVNSLYNQLQTTYNNLPANNKAAFPGLANTLLVNYSLQVSNFVITLADPVSGPAELLDTIDGKLDQARASMDTARSTLVQASTVAPLLTEIVGLFAPENAGVVAAGLNEAVTAVQPTINQVNSILGELESGIAQIQQPLAEGGEWAGQLNSILLTANPQIQIGITGARQELSTFFAGFNYAVDNPFTHYGPQEMKNRIRQAYRDRFLTTPAIANIQSSIKQRVFDKEALYQQSLDTYLGQVNKITRDLLAAHLQEIDNTINNALGFVGDYLGAGKVTGHAVINEDSLRFLRLDAKFRFKIPEELSFHGFMEIREIDSENTVEGCVYAGGTATEVKIGAIDVPLDWISPDLRCDVQGQFVIGNDNTLRGLGGAFQTRGALDFGGFTVKQIGFAIAFGEQENYFAANARVKMGQSVEIAGGAFFGRACSIDPIATAVMAVSPFLLMDVNPYSIFGEPPYTGAFVYGEGRFPVWSFGCLFEVRVTVGGGGWYFKEGPKWGGIIKGGIGGTVLCVLSADGTMTLIAANNGKGMTYTGLAHVEGCFGFCPFCICVDADTTVQYGGKSGDWEAEEP
jgi:hypothetical protein